VPENCFDERIANSYEARWPELFEPAMTVADQCLGHVEGTASGRLPDQAVDGADDEEHQHKLAAAKWCCRSPSDCWHADLIRGG
jgi:hypothetical protein